MGDSEWVYGSGRSGKPRPKKDKRMKCPVCGNGVDTYTDGTVGKHKDYGKDKNGKPKTKGPWAYCTWKRWR